jgi:hypothetical protein
VDRESTSRRQADSLNVLGTGPIFREVHSIPTSDLAFHEYALAALDRTDGLIHIDEVAAALMQLLRPIYPDIEVRRQDVYARIREVDVWI